VQDKLTIGHWEAEAKLPVMSRFERHFFEPPFPQNGSIATIDGYHNELMFAIDRQIVVLARSTAHARGQFWADGNSGCYKYVIIPKNR
jgi:hypothetical protein